MKVSPLLSVIWATSFVLLGDVVFSFPAPQPKNNSQERKDGQKIQAARQDVNEVEKKLQAVAKEIRTAEVEYQKLQEALRDAKVSYDTIKSETEKNLSNSIGIPAAIEAQKKAQMAYDEAAKPLIASMQTNPKYTELFQKAVAADKSLKELASKPDIDPATKQQIQSQASKVMSDWRYARDKFLETASEMKIPREQLAAAQAKLTDLRSLLKKQLDNHPDPRNAESKFNKAKEALERKGLDVAAKRRKAAADQSKLAAERSQLSKAMAQDKQNDNKNNNNKNKSKNKNKNNKNR